MEILSKFLTKAKKQTYANKGVEKVNPTRMCSHDYEYSDGNFKYHDTYFGGINFMGEEIVYEQGEIPIWGMNYYGITFDESLSEEMFNNVLRPALMQVGSDDIIPVRGPREYIIGEYKYTFSVNGDLSCFNGEEVICKNDDKIYVLICHGGKIS